MDTDALRLAILSDDAKTIAKAPGIGPKTASKLILELKDKCHLEDVFGGVEESFATENVSAGADAKKDAIEALVALGLFRHQRLPVRYRQTSSYGEGLWKIF